MTRVNKSDVGSGNTPNLEVSINGHHIKVFKCCMSCDFKNISSTGGRVCSIFNKKVDKYGMCDKWLLSRGLERAGAGKGKVDIHCRDKFIQRRMEELERLGFIKSNEKSEQKTSGNQ